MKRVSIKQSAWAMALIAALVLLGGMKARAEILGETVVPGTPVNLVARQGFISTSDGDSFLMWGYGLAANTMMQYPGPTLLVNEGDTFTVTLRNDLPSEAGNVSIVFPGLSVTAIGGLPGMLAREAPPDATTIVTYTVTASQPGTYLYRSGTRPDLQVEMGLVGAIIVYPDPNGAFGPLGDGTGLYAYNNADSFFNHEFLYLITEMDPMVHRQVEFGQFDKTDTTSSFRTNWFINGRNWPDLMADPNVPWLPTQPYNCQPIMNAGDLVLLRTIGGGRDLHPMHYHGNDFDVIAVDGRLLSSDGGAAGADLAWKDNTIRFVPGQTADLIWTWTGEKLGWDAYGHEAGVDYPRSDFNPAWTGNVCEEYLADPVNASPFDPFTHEYCPDHGVPFPVLIPTRDSVTFGEFYSGSPFLGITGDLPPGHPALNAIGGYFYMWHSHTEKEITSNDIFPGGLISFMIVIDPASAHGL